jgi:rod shape determining protein RodA
VLGVVASVFDYRMLRAYAPVLYLLSIAGLVAVLSPLGSTINGSHSWIVLPAGFSIQPSELAKVALVVGMAMLLSEKRDAEDTPRDVDVVMTLAFAAVPLALVMLQPDLGTALVVSAIVLGVVAVSGAPLRWVVGLVLGCGCWIAFVAVQTGLLKDYQLDRFRAFYDPTADPKGAATTCGRPRSRSARAACTARVCSMARRPRGRFVPAQQTDFIFTGRGGRSSASWAPVCWCCLLGVVLWRAGRIAMKAEDLFGRLLATGVLCWFAFQSFENIGMTLGDHAGHRRAVGRSCRTAGPPCSRTCSRSAC